jgi:hypothetical protein
MVPELIANFVAAAHPLLLTFTAVLDPIGATTCKIRSAIRSLGLSSFASCASLALPVLYIAGALRRTAVV